jgi:V8-like Glu-specific endopeptidase
MIEGADPGIIPEEIADVLSNSIVRIEYPIDSSKISISTGFFIKLKIKEKSYHFLFTCEHSLKEEQIQSEITIFLYFGKAKKERLLKMRLDQKERFIKAYKDLDITIIQILPKDNISEDKFLLPDFNYINGASDYIDKQIYIGGYPKVIIHKKEKHFSSGVIRSLSNNKTNFFHSSDTREGSSGSPIVNSDKKVIGIHNGAYQEVNYGTFISSIIDRLTTERNIEKINDNTPYENNNKEINDEEESNERQKDNIETKKDEDKNEDEQPKEDIKINTFNETDYINNIINNSPVLTLSKENMSKFGNLVGNPNYVNYVKNYYSNPVVREGLKNDQNFQNLLKINPAMKMVYDNPEIIDKMFTPEMCNNMSKALINGNNEEINAVDQKITNTIINELNKKNDNDNN